MSLFSNASGGPQFSRRQMLAALGMAGAAAASVPVLSSCGVGGKPSAPNGADAVTDLRFTTSVVMGGAAEMLAFGNAVRLEKE